jgi:omega-6 fatty acid desaturase (delta-12 desaturase)
MKYGISEVDFPNKTKTTKKPADKELIASFARPDWRRSTWQLINSVIPYFALLTGMYYSLDISYWLTLGLAVPAAGFLIRIFIIFHDCGHGSFFKSQKISTVVGYFTGILAFVPYHDWRFSHARHHATSADLDRRGTGDVWTLTTIEYLALSGWDRMMYRLFRHPLVMFGIGPFWASMVVPRFAAPGTKKRERRSIHYTNLALIFLIILMSWLIGFKTYVMIQLPVIGIAWTLGIWLFYVQHQYEDVYWDRHETWDYQQAALQGSSYYKLPAVIQWFTGNIGFHHVHHLNARIPNYNLEKCHRQVSLFRDVKPITIFSSLRSLRFRLYDEELGRMIGFRELKPNI